MMESALTARDRVGVQDFVLLENHTSEVAFIDNLRKRFKENLIYVRMSSLTFLLNAKVHLFSESVSLYLSFWFEQTYIGSVLVSVNPYKDLEIYTKQHMERYRGVNFYEVSPHMWVIIPSSITLDFKIQMWKLIDTYTRSCNCRQKAVLSPQWGEYLCNLQMSALFSILHHRMLFTVNQLVKIPTMCISVHFISVASAIQMLMEHNKSCWVLWSFSYYIINVCKSHYCCNS